MAYSSMEDLRAARNLALQNSDFYILPDYKFTGEFADENKTLIMLYRQYLRDLPSVVDENDLTGVELPVFPEFHPRAVVE